MNPIYTSNFKSNSYDSQTHRTPQTSYKEMISYNPMQESNYSNNSKSSYNLK